jgi:hypothetical protein
VQVLGITEDERAAIRTWDASAMRPVLAQHLPLLITDLDRRSLLSNPEVDQAITGGRIRDGSSLGWVRSAPSRKATWSCTRPGRSSGRSRFGTVGRWTCAHLLDPQRAWLARRRHGHHDRTVVRLVPQFDGQGELLPVILAGHVDEDGQTHPGTKAVRLLSDTGLADDPRGPRAVAVGTAPDGRRYNTILKAVAAALRPVAGTYEVPGLPELVFRVERTAVRDQQGNVTGHVG